MMNKLIFYFRIQDVFVTGLFGSYFNFKFFCLMQFFGFRTTLSLRQHESNAIQQLFAITPSITPNTSGRQNPRDGGVFWRLDIYQRLLYAMPLYDITGRYRDCSAFFYGWIYFFLIIAFQWLWYAILRLINCLSEIIRLLESI